MTAPYISIIAGGAMGDVINDRTYGMLGTVGAGFDVVPAPGGGGGYAFCCDLTVDGQDSHGRLTSRSNGIYWDGPTETTADSQWLTWDFLVEGTQTGDARICYWCYANSDDPDAWWLKLRNSDKKLELMRGSATSWDIGNTALETDRLYRAHALFWRTTSLCARLWIEGLGLEIEAPASGQPGNCARWYLGEDLPDGVNRGVKVYFQNISLISTATPTEDPGWPKVATLLVNGQGTYTDFTGTYAAVDEVPPNGDTDYVTTNTISKKESFTLQSCADAGIPADATILGVCVRGWHRIELPDGKFNAPPFFKLGATEVDGFSVEPGLTYRNLEGDQSNAASLRRLDPDDADWTQTSVNALEIGVRTRDTDHDDTWLLSAMSLEVLYLEAAAALRSFAQVI